MWVVPRLFGVNRGHMNACVGARGENARVVRVAINTRTVAHESGTRNVRRRDHGALDRGTGDEKERDEQGADSCRDPRNFPPAIALRRRCTQIEHDGVCNESLS
jgi:hypothetical protein